MRLGNMLIMALGLAAQLFANAASPMIRPDSGNIVDVGSHTPQTRSTVPKAWMQYAATYGDVQRAIIGKMRIYSDPELCLSDEDYVENCPIDKSPCAPNDEWTTGSAVHRTSTQLSDSTVSDVATCTENNQTHCEYYHDTMPQTVTTLSRAANRYSNYDWQPVLTTYCADAGYTLGMVNGSQKCYLEDVSKRIYSGYDTYEQCYLQNGTEAIPSNRIRCSSLSDWQRLASLYYGGAVFDQGTQAASCTQSTINPDWGDWCGTNMRTVTGCSDGYTRVARWRDTGEDDKWTSCLDLKSPSHTCQTGYTYHSYYNQCYKFTGYTYTCPAGYGNMDADHICHKDTYGCEPGFVGPDANGTCHKEGYIRSSCPSSTLIEQDALTGLWKCRYTYYYYDYTCPADVNVYEAPWEIQDAGGDCGGCGANGCVCNDPFPPANNCHRLTYVCPFDNSKLCTEIPRSGEGEIYTNKPMIVHEIDGEYVPTEYGNVRQSHCGAGCEHAVYRIDADGERLRFRNRTGNDANLTVLGCTLSGTIEAGSGGRISAIRTAGGSDPHTLRFFDQNGNSLGTISSSCPVNGAVGIPRLPMRITSVITRRDQLWFWDSYEDRGAIGMIEFVKEVDPEDAAEGYRPTPVEAFELRSRGFDDIFFAENSVTYAVSLTGLTPTECSDAALSTGFAVVTYADVANDDALKEIVDNTIGSIGGGTGGTQTATCFGGQDASLFYNPATDRCERTGDCLLHLTFYSNTASERNETVSVSGPETAYSLLTDTGEVAYIFYVSDRCEFTRKAIFWPDSYNWEVGVIQNPPTTLIWAFMYSSMNVELSPASAATSEVPQCPANAIGRNGADCIMPSGSVCMLQRRPDFSFARTTFAQKATGIHSEPPKWFCSPYVCADHSCQKATCYAGFTGSLIPVDMNNPPEPGDCTAQICDANKPHYEFCGKYKDCPTEQPDVVRTAGGCKRVTCAEGGYNPDDKMCYKWQCPTNTTEIGGECVPN